ncbi:response regulator [Mesorhizobium sp.]|uniref:response regulator transcription factor n=1 Tax=Mesorhizobium sp. TaxID=1871066 RepID=UPI00338D8F36
MNNLFEAKRRNVLAIREAASTFGLAAKPAERTAHARVGAAQGGDAIPLSRINLSEETLVNLRRRLAATRWPKREAVNDFLQGMELAQTADARSSMSSQDQPVVFVVDDDVSVRLSLESLILSAGWCPKAFESALAFFSHPRPNVPNCLILDVNLPDISGLDLQKLVSAEWTDTPIVFVTGFGDVAMTVKAMKAGAVEFLMKPFHADTLLSAVKEALERSRTALEFNSEVRALQDRHASLSCREQEVMALVVSGLLNKQVGFELGISEITVKAHRGQVMRKMKARSLPDLVNMAARLNLTQ